MILSAPTVIGDYDHSSGFERLVKHLEQAQLVLNVQNGIATVDHIVELFRVVHKRGIFNVKVAPVLDQRWFHITQVLGNVDHVLRQVKAVDIHAIIPCHVKGGTTDATTNIQDLVTLLMKKRLIKYTQSLILCYCHRFIPGGPTSFRWEAF